MFVFLVDEEFDFGVADDEFEGVAFVVVDGGGDEGLEVV